MRLCKNYVTPVAMQVLFSLDVSLLVDFNQVSRFVFASAVFVLFFESFPTGPGYTKNCKFLFISCSTVVDLVDVTFLLKCLYLYVLFCIGRDTDSSLSLHSIVVEHIVES